METIRTYLCLLKLSICAQTQYKRDFIIESIIWFVYSLVPFVSLSFLLEKFNTIGTLSLYQVAILYGTSQISYDFARMFGRGFDNFAKIVLNGDFDTFYIRPLSIIGQVFASDLFLRRLSGIIVGAMVCIWGIVKLNVICPLIIGGIVVVVCSAILMYLGLFILNSAMILITVKDSPFSSYMIDIAAQSGYYPLDSIKNPLKSIFTFVIPIGCCIYYPICDLLNTSSFTRCITGLLIGASLFSISIVVFNLCRKKYLSVNN